MRTCACLWGGIYNPIIPVFKRSPKNWRTKESSRFTGKAIASGYVRFFEPDVYVESEDGLLEQAGLGALRKNATLHSQVVSLPEFFKSSMGRDWSEPSFGLSMHDVLGHIYQAERRFVHRERQESVIIRSGHSTALAEAVFGVYPPAIDIAYFRQDYIDVFSPTEMEETIETWRNVFMGGQECPLRVTRYGIEVNRNWYHDVLLFVFDPRRAIDLIDLWNLRLEPHPVLPIPVGWFGELVEDIAKILKEQHRPVVGNPNGIMHRSTIEFSRSISEPITRSLVGQLRLLLTGDELSIKHWRNPVWVQGEGDRINRDSRMKISANERRVILVIKDRSHLSTTFQPIETDFSTKYSSSDYRWANTIRIEGFRNETIAEVIPFNAFDRSWPRLSLGGEPVPVGREGWVFLQKYSRLEQYVSLLSFEEALTGALEQIGVQAELSEPGRIAKQMLENIGGLWGVGLISDLDVLILLNKMAGGVRRKVSATEVVEETFELRTAPLKDWTDLDARLRRRRMLPVALIKSLTERNVIRLGVETDCPHCKMRNWSTLTKLDYEVRCDRCLKLYSFPQADLRSQNKNWTYRVVGPFSVPDFGRGSYCALLALRVLGSHHGSVGRMTYATAMNLRFDKIHSEVDFIAWMDRERAWDEMHPPRLAIGESKSLGRGDLINSDEVSKLKAIAERLGGAAIVIAVLRDSFTASERKLIQKLATWGRRYKANGEPMSPVILLTTNELMMEHSLSLTWKALGGEHAKFKEYYHGDPVMDLAEATQRIYL